MNFKRHRVAVAALVTGLLVSVAGVAVANPPPGYRAREGSVLSDPGPCPGATVQYLPGAKGIRSVLINGKDICFPDAYPGIVQGRTLIPVRFISEAMGAEVAWDGENRIVTITQAGKTIVLPIGKAVAKVNGQEVAFDVPANIYLGRTYVPLRFVSEALGAKVDWDADNYDVLITTPDGKDPCTNPKVWCWGHPRPQA